MDNKKVLPGVRGMWYGNPSAVCYIGSVMRLMEYIGDPVEQDELFALSGVGLCFPWRFASSCDEVSIIPEIPARTFEALGYDSEYLTGEAINDKDACFVEQSPPTQNLEVGDSCFIDHCRKWRSIFGLTRSPQAYIPVVPTV